MKKIISSILLITLISCTVYADYDYKEEHVATIGVYYDSLYDWDLWSGENPDEIIVHTYYRRGGGHSAGGVYIEGVNEIVDLSTDDIKPPTPTEIPEESLQDFKTTEYYEIKDSENRFAKYTYPKVSGGKRYEYAIVDQDGNEIFSWKNSQNVYVLNEKIISSFKGGTYTDYTVYNADGQQVTDFSVSDGNAYENVSIAYFYPGKYYCLFDKNFNPISDKTYDKIDKIYQTDYFYAQKGSKYDAYDSKGNVIVSDFYGNAKHYSDKTFFEDSDSTVILYDNTMKRMDFDKKVKYLNDNVLVSDENGKQVLMDYKGKYLSDFYDEIVFYPYGNVVWIKKNGKYAVMNTQGKIITDFYDYWRMVGSRYFSAEKNGSSVYINPNGKVLNDVAEITFFYENNKISYYTAVLKNGKKGIIDSNGKTAVPFEYTEMNKVQDYIECRREGEETEDIYDLEGNFINNFSERIICELKPNYGYLYFGKKGNRLAFVDESFNLKSDFIYNKIYLYNDGKFKYCMEKGYETEYADEDFNVIDLTYTPDTTVSEYKYVLPFNGFETKEIGGCVRFKVSDKVYFVDKDGVVLAEFDENAGYTNMSRSKDTGKYYYGAYPESETTKPRMMCDFTGKAVFNNQYIEFRNVAQGKYICATRNNIYYLSSDVVDIAYNTDTRTYINGTEIPCYKVNGYPCIFAEDLDNYGYDLNWDGTYFILNLTSDGVFEPLEIPEKAENNTAFSDLYRNYTTVYIDGEKVNSYNAGGKMLVRTKDLKALGVDITYENLKTAADVLNNIIKVYVNGILVKFDQQPMIVNDRTLVPLRKIFEALGARVYYKDETQTVTAVKDDTTITLQIGDNILYVNGEEKVLDVPAQLVNDRTLVPVRAISEAFGCTVDWDGENNIVTVRN